MKLLLMLLPLILPIAVRWAEGREAEILRNGIPLPDDQTAIARRMGVSHPEKIRLLKVSTIPTHGHFILRWAAKVTGLVHPSISGMSLGYGIFIRKEFWTDPHLLAHECVHTAQYERLGGVRNFLKAYLTECLELGYPEAPMEQEAILKSAELHPGK